MRSVHNIYGFRKYKKSEKRSKKLPFSIRTKNIEHKKLTKWIIQFERHVGKLPFALNNNEKAIKRYI